MSLVRINWRPDARELRGFGATVAVGFGVIGLALRFWLERPQASLWVWIVGGAIGVVGLTGTRLALPLYWAWMGVAFVIGNVISRVVMAALYYGLFTPMGLFMRLFGEDKLRLKRREGTYWIDLRDDGADTRHERQF
ncbi:MAG: SxtJ family membrane protein [Deltaproteobacteria bacterium]|nr:SxtJ family membrane protein [Deltaproteobacteria bacterium]